MKVATIYKPFLRLFILPFLIFLFAFNPPSVHAQDPEERYSEEELAQMLAPIALYPDALLSQILMASTYPIEVIEADRWLRENQGLQGEALDDTLLNKGWDPSVKAICHFPSTLALMSERISETTNLGNAFLAQEAEVMRMIQNLREKAYEQGHLNTTAEQKVIVKKEIIIIEPVNPRIIYIPYYDPYYVYGSWWSNSYSPYYWGPNGVNIGVGISYWPGVSFGVTYSNWSYFDWGRRYVYIDLYKRPRFVRHDRWISTSGRWSHVPSHRRGVAYRDKTTARKYGQSPNRPITYRRDTRGFPTLDRGERNQPRKVIKKADSYRQEQQRVERKIKGLRKVERDTHERQRINMEKRTANRKETQYNKPVRAEKKRQERIELVPEIQKQKQIENKKRQASPETVFNRLENGNRERQYSERGRESRKSLKYENRRDRNESSRNWRKSED